MYKGTVGCEEHCVGKRHRVERVPCMSHVSEQMPAFLCTQLGLTPGILTHTQNLNSVLFQTTSMT